MRLGCPHFALCPVSPEVPSYKIMGFPRSVCLDQLAFTFFLRSWLPLTQDAKWPVMFHNPKFQDALQEPTELEGRCLAGFARSSASCRRRTPSVTAGDKSTVDSFPYGPKGPIRIASKTILWKYVLSSPGTSEQELFWSLWVAGTHVDLLVLVSP